MDELQQLRVTKLRELAKEKNIQKYYRMNKAELLTALRNYENSLKPTTKTRDGVLKGGNEESKKENLVKPLKRTPLMDAKIEFTHMMKVLGRSDKGLKKTRTGFVDNFKGDEITYQFFSAERVRLVVTKNDLVKTFEIEKNCIEMWNEIINYLKETIYYIGEVIENFFDGQSEISKNVNNIDKDKGGKGKEGEDYLELVEITDKTSSSSLSGSSSSLPSTSSSLSSTSLSSTSSLPLTLQNISGSDLDKTVYIEPKSQKKYDYPRTTSTLTHPQKQRPIHLGRRAPSSTLGRNKNTKSKND